MADEREAFSFIISSYSDWLSSITSGSGATRPGIATYRLINDTIFKPTRSGRVLKRTVFSDSVMQLVTRFKAVHLGKDKSSSVQALAPPFKAITLKKAIRKNAPE
jgi:hypothetical protein